MSSALTRAFRRVATTPRNVRRFGSSNGDHGAEEVEKWRKVSIAATGIVVLFSLKEMVDMAGGHHGAHSDKPLPDYMQIRSKPFPWECSSCSLFDTDCFKKCKAERAGDLVEDDH
ncbi:cytochrome c oxidase subunit via [Nannochloropsis oceanica]